MCVYVGLNDYIVIRKKMRYRSKFLDGWREDNDAGSATAEDTVRWSATGLLFFFFVFSACTVIRPNYVYATHVKLISQRKFDGIKHTLLQPSLKNPGEISIVKTEIWRCNELDFRFGTRGGLKSKDV